MKIFYLKQNQIDKDKWDETIRNAPNGNIYAYSWYLDIVSPNWHALVSEDYNYVFPLTHRKKFGFQYLFQPPFSQQLGLFSRFHFDSEILKDFFIHIPAEFKLIEINLNKSCKIIFQKFSTNENANYELDLILPYNELSQNYSENTSRNLKKALKTKTYLSKFVRPEEITKLFRNNRGRSVKTLKTADYNTLHRLMYYCLQNAYGETWGAFDEYNELCAAVFFVKANGKHVFLFSAVNDAGKRDGAMFYLIDNYIKLNSEKPLVFDFEGSNDENLARFYSGFGAKKYSYFSVKLNNLPYFVKLFRRISERLKLV